MIEFRDSFARRSGAEADRAPEPAGARRRRQPVPSGDASDAAACSRRTSLLDALRAGGFDAAFGGARRDEEKSRAKERIFSFRDSLGQWDPKNQRPELWNLFNGRIEPGESIRVFPLSNWTELDVWQYIHVENIPVVPLYFAHDREVVVRGEALIIREQDFRAAAPGDKLQMVMCRMRSLGCSPCTGAVRSDADTLPKIIAELVAVRKLRARESRDRSRPEGSMELKKREGYF